MNPCNEFIMTLAEIVSKQRGNYIPVKKSLPLLYERIGEVTVRRMIAAGVISNYQPRMQKSVCEWAKNEIICSGKDVNKIFYPELNGKVLYDFAKEIIKNERRLCQSRSAVATV